MAGFEELRRRLQDARDERTRAANEAFAARERIKRVEALLATLDRGFDPGNQDHVAERDRLREAKAGAERRLTQSQEARVKAAQALAGAVEAFAPVSDPRQAIGQFDDQVPILLLPVRLETRFKTVTAADGNARPQLWVRIYPDDCSIDTFEATLSETEVANAQLYWTGIWEAGGFADQERGAWRGLVASHGSGRAEWIITNYRPVNLAQRPTKQLPIDIVLTVPTETPLNAAEAAAAAAYWRAVWLGDGDRAIEDAARATLDAAVGSAARGQEIADRYRPANLAKRPPGTLTKSQVNVTTAFVVFPSREGLQTKRQSWSRPPTAELLPDRFVFIGYASDGEPKVEVGRPVSAPLVVGPDPSAPEEEQLQQQDGTILVPEDLRWMVEFDRAVEAGMGIRVDLDEPRFARGFHRVLVLGLRLSADEATAKAELETLLQHHRFGLRGLSLLPQGTPTNNTELAPSGHGGDDADASFEDLQKDALFADEIDWLDKRDGQWLAEYLGIDTDTLNKVRHSGGSDQADARAMNTALWPATLGYWTETMMAPLFGPQAVERLRQFFDLFVSGRGAVPAIRIGKQPYGILPATAFSRLRWMLQPEVDHGLTAAPTADPFLARLYEVLRLARADWGQMGQAVSFAAATGDPHQILLDIVGLHPASVEFWQRYAESAQELFNRLNLEGFGRALDDLAIARLAVSGMDLLRRLGYTGPGTPDILSRFFFQKANLLKGPLIDDRPLSETEQVRAYTADNRNYLQWLIDAANTSLDALYRQQGFVNDQPPTALLYLMLRHALQLGYHEVGLRLYESAGLLDEAAVAQAKREPPFIHVAERAEVSESRYRLLYEPQPAITGTPTTLVGAYIGASVSTLPQAGTLRDQVRALERLKAASTARLERAFAEHLDCCSYRLDAWLLGLVHYQLAAMRNLRSGQRTRPRQGIHLGAYAWLEEVRPKERALTPVRLSPDLEEIFKPADDPPLMRDSRNQGYVQAPSLNQAVAAAVLRNGYLSDAAPENRQTLAVNLTSERVRRALSVLEGIRNGQSLGALLGYQFERGLHDRHGLVEVDKFIFKLRKTFPLRADRLASTSTPPDVPIEAIEARNVLDGLSLVDHIKATGAGAYPFGKDLPAATVDEANAINAEVNRLLDTHDAVADLALAEGVYQAVLGNYDRVASTYDAYSKGNFPPEPQVVQTPRSGVGLTHRVALHLEAGVDPTVSPVPGVPMSPRAQAEPALNSWLETVLPPLSDVACVVSFKDAATNAMVEREVRMLDLGVQPADLVRLVRDQSEQAMAELDDRVLRFTMTTHTPRPDTPVSIRYRDTSTAPLSVFQIMPLTQSLRSIAELSRPLRASDLALMNEATQDTAVFVHRQRVVRVRDAMQTLRTDLAAFQAGLETLLADLEHRRDDVIADVDTTIDDLVALLARAAGFAVTQAGWGFAYDLKRRVFASILQRSAELATRWTGRLAEFDGLITAYDNLPATATDQERFDVLQRAERLVSTATTAPLPATPDAYKATLPGKRATFANRRDDFAAVQDTDRSSLAQLRSDVTGLIDGPPPISDLDAAEFSLAEADDEVVRFAQDAVSVATVVVGELDRRLAASQALLGQHDAAAQPTVRVNALSDAAKALLGDDFVVIPEFDLNQGQGDELQNALDASTSKTLFDYLENTAKVPFPVDTWLYGVARVRDKMRAWEQIVMLTGAFGATEPDLTAMQLPFIPGDQWLALQFPLDGFRNAQGEDVPPLRLDTDRLLYSAHFATPFRKASRQCGLLLDEWNEVIPATTTTTGITFHYDRPNSEAPQAMLLVTPAEFTGAWRWADLVDAANETLDLAKSRAVEPADVERTPYTRFLPAAITAVTVNQLTISANLALNNRLEAFTGGS